MFLLCRAFHTSKAARSSSCDDTIYGFISKAQGLQVGMKLCHTQRNGGRKGNRNERKIKRNERKGEKRKNGEGRGS